MRLLNLFRRQSAQTTQTAARENQTASDSIFSGRAYSGRAELRHHNLVLKVIIFLQFAIFFWNDHAWRMHADRLAEKQWIVFHDRSGVTSSRSAEEFRTGPSDEEIKAKAWDAVRWIAAAGSSNVDTCYAEARTMMTVELRTEFDETFGPARRKALKDLNVYRKIDKGAVRQMLESDLPQGSRIKPSRYDMIVTGQLDTYRVDTNERIAAGPIAFKVRLVPVDRRTVENPAGLLVSEMAPIQLKDQSQAEQKKEEEKK